MDAGHDNTILDQLKLKIRVMQLFQETVGSSMRGIAESHERCHNNAG